MKEISELFEIFIFTASISQYASPLIDKLDKENLFNGRFFRQHCIYNNGLYLKDLKQIGKDLKDIIIIDNNPASYAINQDNGLPILTWYDDINDNELNKLIPLLRHLSDVDDVRPIIKRIVDREKNEINFELVQNLINNKNKEKNNYKKIINGGNNNANYKFNEINNIKINNLPIKKYEHEDSDIDFHINNNNYEENKYKKYSDFGNKNINNSSYLYKYNKEIKSMSNMSYEEIKFESQKNSKFNEHTKNYNLNLLNKFSNGMNNNNIKNNILNKTKEVFNGLNHNEKDLDLNEKNIFEYKNEKRSFTPNINIDRKNSFYNMNNFMLKNKKSKNINNITDKIQENIKNINELQDNINNNFNFRNPILLNGNNKNSKAKVDNYLRVKEQNNLHNNYYLQNSQKNNISTKNDKLNNNQKIFRVDKNNNKKKKEENNTIKSFINSDNNSNNINIRNINDNIIRIGFNYNTLNNNKLNRNNKLENNNNSENNIGLDNYLFYSRNKEKVNNNLIKNLSATNDLILKNSFIEEKKKSVIDLRREKLNEIKRKMEEITKDIKQTEEKLYHTQNNFMIKNGAKKNDNLYSEKEKNFSKNKIKKEIKESKDKNKLKNHNKNNFNEIISANKNMVPNNSDKKRANSFYSNKGLDNHNNKRTINTLNSDDIDFFNNNSINQRSDTEISSNNNYHRDTIFNDTEKSKSARSIIINKKMNNFNNENNENIKENYFNNTYNNYFNISAKNMNNDYLEKEDRFSRISMIKGNINNKDISSLYRNYNIININKYNNISNSLLNENKIKDDVEQKINNKNKIINKKIDEYEYNGNNRLIMNKISSNFYPKLSKNIGEEEKKEPNYNKYEIIVNNLDKENEYLYN